jgi:hypothetical protein
MRSNRLLLTVLSTLCALAFAAAPATAQCVPYLCYIDLAPTAGPPICPNASVYTVLAAPAVLPAGPTTPTCNTAAYTATVIRINVPTGCSGADVWLQYRGEPQGYTLDLSDSDSADGGGGDAGSQPIGQNAELQILGNTLSLFSASTNPDAIVALNQQQLALTDGALNVTVGNQFASWGQPFQSVSSPDGRLFNLQTGNANRHLYVGLNRTVANAGRNGCGARRALISLR